MSLTAKPGGKFKVTIKGAVKRDAARKTLTRLFMRDKTVAAPLEARSANFKAKPKRRGGRIWTKWPNKIHLTLKTGLTATLPATGQYARDLNSVAEFVDVTVV
jgi:hypothetical protein